MSETSNQNIFINVLNSYNGRHLVKVLLDSTITITVIENHEKVKEEAGCGSGQYGHWYDSKACTCNCISKEALQKPPTYQITGTIEKIYKVPPPAESCEIITQPRGFASKQKFRRKILRSSVTVFDISNDVRHIDDARLALTSLIAYIKSPSKNLEMKKFILISSVMTWAYTKRRHTLKLPLTEKDFLLRKSHPKYNEHFILERDVFEAGKMNPDRLQTTIVWSGLTYGFEEGPLHKYFKHAWNSADLPIIGAGLNKIPLIHVQDLSKIVKNIIQNMHDSPEYMFAVEKKTHNLKENIGAICNTMGVKCFTCDLIPEKEPEYPDIEDILKTDINIWPEYIMTKTRFAWRSMAPFKENISSIVQEYLTYRNLTPLKIVINGLKGAGKTTIAKRLCDFYGLKYIKVSDLLDLHMQELMEKLRDLSNRLHLIKESGSIDGSSQSSCSCCVCISPMQERSDKPQRLLMEGHHSYLHQSGSESQNDYLCTKDDTSTHYKQLRKDLEKQHNKVSNQLMRLQMNRHCNGGSLSDDEVVRIFKLKCEKNIQLKTRGYVLDGFPETASQAALLFNRQENIPLWDESDREQGQDQLFNCQPNLILPVITSDKYIIERQIKASKERSEFEDKLLDSLSDHSQIKRLNSTLEYFLNKNIAMMPTTVDGDVDSIVAEIISKIGPPRTYEGFKIYKSFFLKREKMENRGKEERLILKKMRLTLVRALTVYMNEVISDISLTSASTSLSSTDLDGGGIETDYNTEYSTYRFDEDSMNTVVQRTVTPEGLSSSDASSGQDDSELRLHHINEPNETQSQCHLPYILINADSSIDIPFTTSEIDALESGILSDEVTPIGSAFDTSGTLCEAITVFFRYLSTYATDLITTGAGFVIACFHLIFRLVEELICPTTPVNETPEGEIDDDVWEISTSSYEDTPYQ